MFNSKTLLITGGTGSFGNAVLNRFLETDIGEVRIFSRDEKKQDDMRHKYRNPKLKFYLGDVRDYESVDYAMRGVDYVFHAAALKQVPSCEFFPIEAVKTNILGAENVIKSAIRNKIEKLIGLSTDKAVYPVNAMGMSKAMMEKVMVANARALTSKQTLICGTRYGNVMASRGSVIPLFVDQIKNKKPITITDPDMTRFMMSLEDAVELVLFAFENAEGGDIFVQKAPASTVEELARALKKIFKVDNEIQIIGTRHGEKKHETLLNREEMARAEDLGNYFKIIDENKDLRKDRFFEKGKENVSKELDYTSENTHRLKEDELIELLLKLDFIKNELK